MPAREKRPSYSKRLSFCTSESDKRKRLLELTAEGKRLEQMLRKEQVKLLERAFDEAGESAVLGWPVVNQALGRTQMPEA